jgi:tetratricopeptide (TPR) repeat protein
MAELHLLRGRLDEALECIERRTQLAQRYENRRIESACWEQKARAYELKGETDTAVDCLRKSFEIARRPVPAGDLYEYLEAVARRLPYGQRPSGPAVERRG